MINRGLGDRVNLVVRGLTEYWSALIVKRLFRRVFGLVTLFKSGLWLLSKSASGLSVSTEQDNLFCLTSKLSSAFDIESRFEEDE